MQRLLTRHGHMRPYLIAVPVLLTIHNIEEVTAGLGASRDAVRTRLPAALGSLVGSPEAWLMAVVVITLVPWLLVSFGVPDRRDSGLARALVVLQAGMSLNVLSHVAATVAMRSYTGGVVTAVLLYVPFSLRFFPLAWREEWVSRRFLRWSPALALLLVPAAVRPAGARLGRHRVTRRVTMEFLSRPVAGIDRQPANLRGTVSVRRSG